MGFAPTVCGRRTPAGLPFEKGILHRVVASFISFAPAQAHGLIHSAAPPFPTKSTISWEPCCRAVTLIRLVFSMPDCFIVLLKSAVQMPDKAGILMGESVTLCPSRTGRDDARRWRRSFWCRRRCLKHRRDRRGSSRYTGLSFGAYRRMICRAPWPCLF